MSETPSADPTIEALLEAFKGAVLAQSAAVTFQGRVIAAQQYNAACLALVRYMEERVENAIHARDKDFDSINNHRIALLEQVRYMEERTCKNQKI